MSIDAIAAVSAQLPAALPAAPAQEGASIARPEFLAAPQATGVDGVFDRLVDSLAQIDAGMKSNARATTELALGQSENLHQVMIGAERTRLQFELAMSMRNRVLEAYQEIMRMQV